MNPLFNSSGYVLDSRELKLLQKDGWGLLPLTEIADVKKKLSLTSMVVRMTDGRKESLDLSHLSAKGFSEVRETLDKARRHYRARAAQGENERAAGPNVLRA